MNNLPDIPDGGGQDDVRAADVFETPYEAEVLGSELPDDKHTVSPDEEGPVTRGFQNGSWQYQNDASDKPMVGRLENDLGDIDSGNTTTG